MDYTPLPSWSTPHTVSIRAYEGTGGGGPVFADPVDASAFAEDEQKVVLDGSGAEVVSTSVVYVNLDVTAPPGSLVTVWPDLPHARQARVVVSELHHHPTLPSYQTLRLA